MNIQDIKKQADGTILVNKKLKNVTFRKRADGLHCLVNNYLYSWSQVETMADGIQAI